MSIHPQSDTMRTKSFEIASRRKCSIRLRCHWVRKLLREIGATFVAERLVKRTRTIAPSAMFLRLWFLLSGFSLARGRLPKSKLPSRLHTKLLRRPAVFCLAPLTWLQHRRSRLALRQFRGLLR